MVEEAPPQRTRTRRDGKETSYAGCRGKEAGSGHREALSWVAQRQLTSLIRQALDNNGAHTVQPLGAGEGAQSGHRGPGEGARLQKAQHTCGLLWKDPMLSVVLGDGQAPKLRTQPGPRLHTTRVCTPPCGLTPPQGLPKGRLAAVAQEWTLAPQGAPHHPGEVPSHTREDLPSDSQRKGILGVISTRKGAGDAD